MAEEKRRRFRDTALASVDKEAPAYRIIYGVFGGLTPFCEATGVKPPTAHLWLKNGIIPDNKDRRHAHILDVAKDVGKAFDPSMFVRLSQAA